MKKFSFPLARVLDWRRTQVLAEESKLQRLYAELHSIEARLGEIRAAREQAGQEVLDAGSATGLELTALDQFRKASTFECVNLTASATASRRRIALQLQVALQKRRDVKLLELLHARKREAWNAALNRETDNEAGELFLAKLTAARARSVK
jgi:flagellar export protein FliJ